MNWAEKIKLLASSLGLFSIITLIYYTKFDIMLLPVNARASHILWLSYLFILAGNSLSSLYQKKNIDYKTKMLWKFTAALFVLGVTYVYFSGSYTVDYHGQLVIVGTDEYLTDDAKNYILKEGGGKYNIHFLLNAATGISEWVWEEGILNFRILVLNLIFFPLLFVSAFITYMGLPLLWKKFL